MQKSKIGLVLFNDKFEDGSLSIPPLFSISSSSTSPRPPLYPPLSKLGNVAFFTLLHGRGEKMRLHLASFIKKPIVRKKKLKLSDIKTNDKKEKKQNRKLQKRILACKSQKEIETLLIQEGVLKVNL